MSTQMSGAAKFAAMPDETLFGTTVFWEGESDAFNAEKAKRLKAKEQERQRLEREQLERTRQKKDGLAYTDMLASEICERIASGELLTVICLDNHMPTVRRCNSWLHEHSEFKLLYEQSLQDRLSIFEEQIIQIPDEAARDFDVVKVKGTEKRVLDPARITSAKLRVEVRRLHLIAGRPNKWGSSTTLITKSEDGFDPANLSADELENQIAEFEKKSRITRVA
jgi:hypothetical protein